MRDMKKGFDDLEEALADLEDDISSVKTTTKRDFRKVNVKLAELEESIKNINTRLDEDD